MFSPARHLDLQADSITRLTFARQYRANLNELISLARGLLLAR